MFEFVLLILLTYWVGNLSVVALGANVISNVEFLNSIASQREVR